MTDFEALRRLHQCTGLQRYLCESLQSELEVQLYIGIVSRLTYSLALQADPKRSKVITQQKALRAAEDAQIPKKKDIISRSEKHDPEENDDSPSVPCADGEAVVKTVAMAVDVSEDEGEDWDDEIGDFSLTAEQQQVQLQNLKLECEKFHRKKSAKHVQVEDSSEAADEEMFWEEKDVEEKQNYTLVPGNPKKVFIGNVNFRTPAKRLWEFFQNFGPVQYCLILRDSNGRSKGRGFVTFVSEESVDKVLSAPEDEMRLDHRNLYVCHAKLKKFNNENESCTSNEVTTSVDSNANVQTGQGTMAMDNETGDVPLTPDSAPVTDAQTHIRNLNMDIMLHIFSYLSLKERIQMERVCRQWRSVSLQAWQTTEHLSFRGLLGRFGGLRDEDLKQLLKRGCPVLKSLDLTAAPRLLGDRSLQAMARYCPGLLRLDISGMRCSNKGLKTLAQACSNLQSIKMQNCPDIGEDGLWWLFHLCKELRSIDMDGIKRLSGKCIHMLGENVEMLSMKACTKLRDVGLEKVGLRCSRLKELRICQCVGLSNKALEQITQSLSKSLTVLHISGKYPRVDVVGLQSLGQLEHLEELFAAQNYSMDDSVLQSVGLGCLNLRVLDVSCCQMGITDTGLAQLSHCQGLQVLNISYLHQVAGEGLRLIARKGTLQVLTARGCGALTDTCIHELARLCHRLTELDLSGCEKITSSSVESFVDTHTDVLVSPALVTLTVGGTKVQPTDLPDLPPTVRLDMADLCQYHLRVDRDFALFFDSEEDDDEAGEASDDEQLHQGRGPSLMAAEAFLVADDPLDEEDWEFS